VAALVPLLAAATVVMATIAGASATMIKMALWQPHQDSSKPARDRA
jgi:hypothetical protein